MEFRKISTLNINNKNYTQVVYYTLQASPDAILQYWGYVDVFDMSNRIVHLDLTSVPYEQVKDLSDTEILGRAFQEADNIIGNPVKSNILTLISNYEDALAKGKM